MAKQGEEGQSRRVLLTKERKGGRCSNGMKETEQMKVYLYWERAFIRTITGQQKT